nr:hypothetical protein [Tanacetum cinerariifolium]
MDISTSTEGDTAAISIRLIVANPTSASVASFCWLIFLALRNASNRCPRIAAPTGFLTVALRTDAENEHSTPGTSSGPRELLAHIAFTLLPAASMNKALLALLLMVIISLGWLRVGAALDPALLSKAKQEYRRNRSKLRNARYLTIIDYRRSILEDRLYVYDLQKQETVIQARVSHAFRSGILYPTAFSNLEGRQQAGPLPGDQLVAQGVEAATLVWSEGMPDWVAAGTVPELHAFFAPAAPALVKPALPIGTSTA